MSDKTVAETIAERQAQAVSERAQSSVPLDQLNEAAKRERYRLLRSKMDMSRLAVKGDPNIHYFWAPAEDRNEMAKLDSLGYTIVREPNVEEVLKGKAQAKVIANGLKEDGTYVVGDVILTQCSMETYEFIMLANSERHEEMAIGAQRDFRSEAERAGVPVFDK